MISPETTEYELRINMTSISIVRIDCTEKGFLAKEETVYMDCDYSRYLGKRVNDALHYFLKYEKELHDETPR